MHRLAEVKWDAKQAEKEAKLRLRMQCGLNAPGEGQEWAYSPSTFAVGMRWVDSESHAIFRVVNTDYPMFGKNEQVKDWVSVGISTPDRKMSERFGKGTIGKICVQCQEAVSGKVKDFIWIPGGPVDRVAISPMFDSLADLYLWMADHNWKSFGIWECEKI